MRIYPENCKPMEDIKKGLRPIKSAEISPDLLFCS